MLLIEFSLEIMLKLDFNYVNFIILVMYYIKYVINLVIFLVMSIDFCFGCLNICLLGGK